jgi:hypothetical protein
VGVVAGDDVRARVGQGPIGFDDVGRRERDVFESGVGHDDDEVAFLLGSPDPGGELVDLPAADAGAAAGSRQVLALAEVEDGDPRSLDRNRDRRKGLFVGETCPDGPDAVPIKDVERLPESPQAIVEDVVVGQAGDIERNGGQTGRVGGPALEHRPALPNGPIGGCQSALAVDDPEIRAAEDGQHVPVGGFRRLPDDRLQGPDRGPVAGNGDRKRARHFIRSAISRAWAAIIARVEASVS